MSSDNPLDPLRAAQEEGFFHEQNKALIAKMKARLAADQTGQALREAGVDDAELVQALLDAGVSKDTMPVLHLAPLLQVAWADGEIQAEERALLVEAARRQGVTEGTPADDALSGLLDAQPSEAFFANALGYLRAVLAAMDPDAAQAASEDLTSLSRQVALAHGKLWGLFGTGVDDAEREALDEIATRLSESKPGATGELMGALGRTDGDGTE